MQSHRPDKRQNLEPQSQTSAAPQASQDIEDFIYLISHDVRASVRALIELPQWICEDLEEAGIKVEGPIGSSIELMNRHAGRLDRMLVDLLAFSRVGRMQTVTAIDLNNAIDEVMDEIKMPAGFKVTRLLDCPEVVMGDRDLPTLLSALISNAIKHHDKETGSICIESDRQGNKVVLSVTDDGPGIDQKYHSRIFAPMTTLRPRDEVEGSGMGLANVAKIAAHYEGAVHISDSAYGRGTKISVSFAGCRLV